MKITSTTFHKPKLNIIVKEGEKHLWKIFHPHHYMSDILPSSCVFYTFYWVQDEVETLVGCTGILFQIAKKFSARRFTRIVVLPEYQGLGFGSKIINSISKYHQDNGVDKVFLSTFHPRLGEFMKDSKYWAASANNLKEFDKNTADTDKKITKLRDGVAMYRYNFIGYAEYELYYNPILILRLKNELKELKSEFGKDSSEYLDKLKEYDNTPKQPPVVDTPPEELNIDFKGHIKSKEEHKKLFNKNKRKVLTSEERKELKQRMKDEKAK